MFVHFCQILSLSINSENQNEESAVQMKRTHAAAAAEDHLNREERKGGDLVYYTIVCVYTYKRVKVNSFCFITWHQTFLCLFKNKVVVVTHLFFVPPFDKNMYFHSSPMSSTKRELEPFVVYTYSTPRCLHGVDVFSIKPQNRILAWTVQSSVKKTIYIYLLVLKSFCKQYFYKKRGPHSYRL